MSSDSGHSYSDLRGMDEETAREHLTVIEFERWERVNRLWDGYEDTKEQWGDEAEEVAALTVHADKSDVGTDLEIFGNEVVIYMDPENPSIREARGVLDDEFGGTTPQNADELDDSDVEKLADVLTTLLESAIVVFNGIDFQSIPEARRKATLDKCRTEWGIQGLVLVWIEIIQAVNEDRQEKLEVVESFRGAERGRDRATARDDRFSDVR